MVESLEGAAAKTATALRAKGLLGREAGSKSNWSHDHLPEASPTLSSAPKMGESRPGCRGGGRARGDELRRVVWCGVAWRGCILCMW